MSALTQQSGASIIANAQIPSVDLVKLVSLLAAAFPEQTEHNHQDASLPVLSFVPENNRLNINVCGVMRRLMADKHLRDAFRQTDNSGFLRDLIKPGRNSNAKMGGKIFQDDFGGLARAIQQLKNRIDDQLDRFNLNADQLLVSNPKAALAALGKAVDLKDFYRPLSAKLVPITFAKAGHTGNPNCLARVFSATEEIQTENLSKQLAKTIADALEQRDDEFDERQREKLIAGLEQEANQIDSQVTRFLNFLEDHAQSRVRLSVSFAIMRNLARRARKLNDDNSKAFVDYVHRIITLFRLYGKPETEQVWRFNLSHDYGEAADFSAFDELVKKGFYDCLPVWAEWKAQIFESRKTDPAATVREVSYRFRVNGKNPQDGLQPAFESRLNRLRETLERTDYAQSPVRKITQVAFLWLVLNPKIPQKPTPEQLQTEAEKLAIYLKDNGRTGVLQLIEQLKGWSNNVKKLSQALGTLAKSSPNVIADSQNDVSDLHLVVQQSIINWAALERWRGKVLDPLVKVNGDQHEITEWLKHVQIAKNPSEVLDSLFSIRVHTTLHERTLMSQNDAVTTLQTQREVPDQLLNIIWQPSGVEIDSTWLMGAGVKILYDSAFFNQKNHPNYSDEDRCQYRAAAISALTVLVYTALQVVAKRFTIGREQPLPALMLRFQIQGENAHKTAGDHLIYAAAQAIEAALMQDLPVRMQGMVTTNSSSYQKLGTAFALSAAFPLLFSATPTIPKIAVVIYATRPCDVNLKIPDADGFIFRAKTYLADAVTAPLTGYRLRFEKMQSQVVPDQDAFENPQLIFEEVARLHRLGYEHIILISNHYSNRRINRSSPRHSPHTQTRFVDEIATHFSTVNLYMLRRDVFTAIRLRSRHNNESAFHTTHLSDHHHAAILPGELVKQLIPVLTFATLTIVGDNTERPQSGFCTYFFDTEQTGNNIEWRERARANLLTDSGGVRESLLAVLRGLHFLETEKKPENNQNKPVLDPFSWVQPANIGGAGEIQVIPKTKNTGGIELSLPAVLTRVSDVLHRNS
ncbi:hypothetical protein [Chromatium okenii]|jgi:hypothetical protein|uniref:Uncharacterized protein n=1 Tax=Chromatium okenii TaxID=61644 RepID=A0A2S7XSA8_9GAMM|nr:hypothetical protein [Chromatium okenii]PQJ96620.1 hypothetical protein CXB77_07435 [Chromatium okenii]